MKTKLSLLAFLFFTNFLFAQNYKDSGSPTYLGCQVSPYEGYSWDLYHSYIVHYFTVPSYNASCHYTYWADNSLPTGTCPAGTLPTNVLNDPNNQFCVKQNLPDCKSQGSYLLGTTCTPACPTGTFASKDNVCVTCPEGTVYYYNQNTCIDPQTCSNNMFMVIEGQCNDMTPYDNDPYQCIKHGGFPSIRGVGEGGIFAKSGFGFKMVPKCNDRQHEIDGTIPLVAGVTGNISGRPDLLGSLIGKGIDKLKNYLNDLFTTSAPKDIANDLTLSLPKYSPTTKTYEPEIVTNPIPKGSDGVTPSRSPDITLDTYNEFLRTEYFPANNLDSSSIKLLLIVLIKLMRYSEITVLIPLHILLLRILLIFGNLLRVRLNHLHNRFTILSRWLLLLAVLMLLRLRLKLLHFVLLPLILLFTLPFRSKLLIFLQLLLFLTQWKDHCPLSNGLLLKHSLMVLLVKR